MPCERANLLKSIVFRKNDIKMEKFSKIESQFFKLIEGEISVKEFEEWVYASEWLERELGQDRYFELISLNYNQEGSKSRVVNILESYVDYAKHERKKIISLLNSIIQKNGNEAVNLMKCYEYYCDGYFFFEDLGLGIGLLLSNPNKYEVEHWHELNERQKTELLESVYPKAKELALELRGWLEKEEIILTGRRSGPLKRWEYADNRSEADRLSRLWKVVARDPQTGEVRAKQNILLNENKR